MFTQLAKPKYFYSLFFAFWAIIQVSSGNIFETFNQLNTTPDAYSYVESAKSLIRGEYPWFRAVGYPLILLPFYAIGGFKLSCIALTIIQTVAWLISLRLIFKTLVILKQSANLALSASILYAVCLSPLLTTNYLLTETIYIFLLIASLYLIAKWIMKVESKYLWLIFIILAFSALVRPVGAILFYLSGLLVLAHYIKRKSLTFLLPWICGFALLWVHKGLMLHHHNTTELCLSKNNALYHYLYMKARNYPDLNATKYEKPFFKESNKLTDSFKGQEFIYYKLDSVYKKRTRKFFISNPYATIKTMYVNLKEEIPYGYSNNQNAANWVYGISKWQHITLFILGIFIIPLWLLNYIQKRTFSAKLIWTGICLSICSLMILASSLVFWYKDRLHLPVYALIIMVSLLLIKNTRERNGSKV